MPEGGTHISYSVYKMLHLAGIFLVLMSLGSLIVSASVGEKADRWRRLGGALNGIGLVVVLVAGFGLIAQLGVGFPNWILLKLLVWLGLGALIALPRRMPDKSLLFWFIGFLLALFAAWLGHYKPF